LLMNRSLLSLNFHKDIEKVSLIGTIISIFRWNSAQNIPFNAKTSSINAIFALL
jgi:hypothetical protein